MRCGKTVAYVFLEFPLLSSQMATMPVTFAGYGNNISTLGDDSIIIWKIEGSLNDSLRNPNLNSSRFVNGNKLRVSQ